MDKNSKHTVENASWEGWDRARAFVYRNARPLDLARWQYHFENGSREAVLQALSYYQNADGGFGHALEPDCHAPESSPIQTWAATEILWEIGMTDASHPIIQGILRYLESGADFSEEYGQWYNVVPANNHAPHAVWWSFEEGQKDSDTGYNPTAALAGFLLRFADPQSSLYEKALTIATAAWEWFFEHLPEVGQHNMPCFIRLYAACPVTTGHGNLVDRKKESLREKIGQVICQETERWENEYVTMPSTLIDDARNPFCEGNEALLKAQCAWIENHMQPDGTFPVNWRWMTEYPEEIISINYWKSDILIKYRRFWEAFK